MSSRARREGPFEIREWETRRELNRMDGWEKPTATAKRKVKIVIFYSAKATQFSKFFPQKQQSVAAVRFGCDGGGSMLALWTISSAVDRGGEQANAWSMPAAPVPITDCAKIVRDFRGRDRRRVEARFRSAVHGTNTWTYLLVFLLFNILSLFIITFPATSCFLQTGVVHRFPFPDMHSGRFVEIFCCCCSFRLVLDLVLVKTKHNYKRDYMADLYPQSISIYI